MTMTSTPLPRMGISVARNYLVEEDNMACIRGTCVITGEEYTTPAIETELMHNALSAWYDSTLIQTAFEFYSAEDREFIISGISPLGWQTLDPGEEDYTS